MFSIGKLATATDCKIPTIRYYEKIGLLPPAQRSAGNQRLYSQANLQQLKFIRHARELGFALPAIRQLIHLSQGSNKDSHQAGLIARQQLQATRSRIERLQSLAQELEQMLISCKQGHNQPCQVIYTLADHQLCQH